MNTTNTPAAEQLAKLAEALYRFSQSLDSSFAMHLKQLAVDLAGALAARDEKEIAGILAKAGGVVSLGERVGAIAANDVKVISAAIDRSQDLVLPSPAKSAPSIAVFAEIAHGETPKAEQVAAEPMRAAQQEARREEIASVTVGPATQPHTVPLAETRQAERISVATVSTIGTPSAAERQERIVAAIRQNPNARMRDLLSALPGVSERTIRYDLERLVTSGIIEREGVGGPATWYRVR